MGERRGSPSEVVDEGVARAAPSLFTGAPEAVGEAINLLLGSVGRAIGAYRAGWIHFESRDALRSRYGWDSPGAPSAIGAVYKRNEFPQSFADIERREFLWAARGATDDTRDLRPVLDDEQSDAVAVVPGSHGGTVLGVVVMDYVGSEPDFDQGYRDALFRLADAIAAAIAHAQTREEAEAMGARLHRRQRLESLGTLAGGIAHDFNNMLQVIQVYSAMIRDDLTEDQADARALSDEVLAACASAADLARRLLVFSREDAHAAKLVNAGAELARVASLARRVLPESIQLELRQSAELSDVHCLCSDFDQAVLNLINNAADAVSDGSIVVSGDVEVLDQDGAKPAGPHARVSIRDRGSGMSPDQLERACEPFFTTKPAGEGTGLGLAMVHGMVERALGRLSIDSELGRGTTVTLWLPTVSQATAAAAAEEPPPGGTERVVVVEDNGIVRRVTRTVLEQAGYTILAAANGDEALRLLAEHGPIDLVVSDVIMPVAGGRQLFDTARAQRPALPFLFCSGYTAGALGDEVLSQPACGFLAKPYRATDLLVAVRTLLDEPPATRS